MKLSTFILDNIEPILQEWENFAKTIFPSDQKLNVRDLRDHAKSMLVRIARDLEEPQSNLEQAEKSKGLTPKNNKENTPAMRHGSDRMNQSFDVIDVISEFRALRASVIKFFTNSDRKILLSDPYDMVRFNEAIDQALLESVTEYTFLKEKQIRHFNELISGSSDHYYTLDLEGNILYMNKAMTDLYSQQSYEILGKAIYNFRMPKVADMLEQIQYIIKTSKSYEGEISYKDDLGNEHFYKYKLAPIFDKDGKIEIIAAASREITEQKIAEKRIWHEANYDLLTGLTNRLMFNDKLELAIKNAKRSGEPMALLFIDLDKFKEINDTLGHAEGDCLLVQVAQRINLCVRETDTASRIGGDEFTVILNNAQDAEQAKIAAEKILSELRKPFELKKTTVHITACIGITMSPQDGIIPDDLLKHADEAMYVSKKSGRDRYSFWELVERLT